ncbi:MAG: hypothetical protein ACFFDB_17155 [Promethearchaeota archaeon]
MGSSSYKAEALPPEIREILDVAIEKEITIIVAEAYGACRLFQDYLVSKDYKNVIVGHARSLRYNAGGWKDFKYGDTLKEREKSMIEDCDFAIVVWQDSSSVIAENLEYLKQLNKPTFLYEYNSSDGVTSSGKLDPTRIYRKYYPYWNR